MSPTLTKFFAVLGVYQSHLRVEDGTASYRIFGRSTKIDDLRNGSDVGTRVLDRALQWLSDNWPDNADWPDDVERPSPHMIAADDGAPADAPANADADARGVA